MTQNLFMGADSSALRYLSGYPIAIQQQAIELLSSGKLTMYLTSKYPERHQMQSDKALYEYVAAIKQRYMKNAPGIDRVYFDQTLGLTHHALGLHTAVSRVHGGKLKAKKEIRIAGLFKQAAPEFLEMIVTHELAHLKEKEHNKAFYQLCQHMMPDYHQVEFDLRLYLMTLDG